MAIFRVGTIRYYELFILIYYIILVTMVRSIMKSYHIKVFFTQLNV